MEHKAYWGIKCINFDLEKARIKIKLQLNELDEWRLLAYENNRIYKEKVKQFHDRRLRHGKMFQEGDNVL